MDFRTTINIPESDVKMDHSHVSMLFGSCFSTHIGTKLQQHKFQVDINPFGIMYNPFSIAQGINRLLKRRAYTEEELVYHQGLYHSLMHHGHFSSPDKEATLEMINKRFTEAADTIQQADFMLVTLGTAYVYWKLDSGEIAGNCHKLPENNFHRALLTDEDIMSEWSDVIDELIEINPRMKVIFTVSPVRHWKDGARQNLLSKSSLHLAIDKLEERYPENVTYFPAFEIMLDELRDYRFYDSDMLHPSAVAIDYIWERFSDTYFSDKTKAINKEWIKIRKALEHRPIHPENEHYQFFLENTKEKLEGFSRNHPHISCQEEIELIQSIIKS